MKFRNNFPVFVRRSQAVRQHMLYHGEELRLEIAANGGGSWSGIGIVSYQPVAGVIGSQGSKALTRNCWQIKSKIKEHKVPRQLLIHDPIFQLPNLQLQGKQFRLQPLSLLPLGIRL